MGVVVDNAVTFSFEKAALKAVNLGGDTDTIGAIACGLGCLYYGIKYLLGIILAAYRDFESRINLVDDKLPAIGQVRVAINEM